MNSETTIMIDTQTGKIVPVETWVDKGPCRCLRSIPDGDPVHFMSHLKVGDDVDREVLRLIGVLDSAVEHLHRLIDDVYNTQHPLPVSAELVCRLMEARNVTKLLRLQSQTDFRKQLDPNYSTSDFQWTPGGASVWE